MEAKVKTWTEWIQTEKLQDALKDIQISICVPPNDKLNEDIFKLLLHLCRVASKCDKQNCDTGQNIAKLTKLLCSLLITIPDDNNFVKALFKIVQCLISFNLYEDAAEICCYLQPGNLYNPQGNTTNLLIKILYLWQILVNDTYLALNDSLNMENYNQLKSVIKYEMKMIPIAYKKYTEHLITRLSKYLDKIFVIDEDKKYIDDFCKYILEYLSGIQLCLDKDEKDVIYCRILRIICRVIYRTVDKNDIEYVVKTVEELSNYFETLLTEDEECCQCFQQFQKFCTTLLVPIENLVSDSAKNIQNITSCNLNIAQKYGYSGGLKWNTLSIAEIVEPMFTYWEKCIENDKRILERLLDTDILLELLNLFLHINANEFYVKQVLIKCKWCLGKCTVKKDLYNTVVMKCRCINLIFNFPVKTLPAKICVLVRKLLIQNVELIIYEMKECKCQRWVQLWNTCRNSIYNVGILSEHIYEESVYLYSFLCICMFQFEGINLNVEVDKNSKKVENIISLVLQRLSIVHCNNNAHRKAMTACALNALLTYNQPNTKAFSMWVNIKKNAPEEIANLTMLECLTSDKNKLKKELGFLLNISKYDTTTLCMCEAKCLLEEQITLTNGVAAVFEKLKKLQSNNQYAHTVQLLGYYFLGFKYDSTILKYYEQTICDLKQDKSNSVAILCLEANLSLFMFVEELHTMNKQTHLEMENTKFALCAPKQRELAEIKSPNVVPAYTMINVKKDTDLMIYLQKSLQKWKKLFRYYFKEIVRDWEPKLILYMLITAGEYARLYRYEDCETEIWTLAYKLALEINDYLIIYITSRYTSLRHINYDWIDTAKEYVMKYKDSKDKDIIETIAIFWITLADLYFECGKYDDAKQLLTEARNLPEISFFGNRSVYLLSLDVITRNNHFYNMQHEDYSLNIEENRLVARSLNQDLLTKKWPNQWIYLFSYDVLFTTAVNLSIRINSILSFRGICPDLVRFLKSAQSLNAMLRTAELMKSLCYIDLSRLQLDNCEVKLQGLEHMLDLETFQLSMESKSAQILSTHFAITPTKIADPVRDMPQYDASPILGKKIFDLPKFTLHENCNCYKCSNVSYQYLVFITTYIRAELYALQNHTAAALNHFHGAFQIRRKLFEEEKSVLPENWPCKEIGVKRLSWQIRFFIPDYIQLLIDFCYFLKTNMSKEQDALDILNLAINTCYKYKLEAHPVYKMAVELALDNDFQLVSSDFSFKFTVPQSHDIDISDHIKVPVDPNVCVTPNVQNHRVKKSASFRIHYKKSPKALKRPKINLVWSDDEDDNSFSPPPATYLNRKFKSCTNLVRRKILDEDLVDDMASLDIEDSVSKDTKLQNLNEDGDNAQNKSTRDIMIKITSLLPDISKSLMNVAEKTDLPATTENINKLIEDVENLKIKSKIRKSIKDTKELTITDYNKNITQAIELLKNMTIKGKTNDDIDSFAQTKSRNIDKLQSQKLSETCNERKFFKRSLKERMEDAGISSTNKSKKSRSKCAKSISNKEDNNYPTRMTRSSIRKCENEKS